MIPYFHLATASDFCFPSHANFLKVVHIRSPHFLILSLTFSNGIWSSLLLKLLLQGHLLPPQSQVQGLLFSWPLTWPFSAFDTFSFLKPSLLVATQTAWRHPLWFSPISLTTPSPFPLLASPPLLHLYLLVSPGLSPGPFSLFYSLPRWSIDSHASPFTHIPITFLLHTRVSNPKH